MGVRAISLCTLKKATFRNGSLLRASTAITSGAGGEWVGLDLVQPSEQRVQKGLPVPQQVEAQRPPGGGVAWVVISHLSNPSAFIPLSSLCTLPLETTVEFAEAGVGADLSPDGFSRWCSGGGQGDRVVTLLGIIGTITHCNLTQH